MHRNRGHYWLTLMSLKGWTQREKEVRERRGKGGSEKRISKRNKNKEIDLVRRGRVAPARHFLMWYLMTYSPGLPSLSVTIVGTALPPRGPVLKRRGALPKEGQARAREDFKSAQIPTPMAETREGGGRERSVFKAPLTKNFTQGGSVNK